jgi:hypothetical protein
MAQDKPATPSAAEILKVAREAYEKRQATPAPSQAKEVLSAAKEGLTPDDVAARQARLQKGGIGSAFDAGGLKFTDAMSFGLLPKFHDLLVDVAGEERMGPRQSQLLEDIQAEYPTGTAVGNVAGTIVPAGAGAKLASTALRAGPAVAGALGSGAATVMDQSVRQATEDKPIDPGEALLSTILGLGPGAALQTGASAAKHAKSAIVPTAKAAINRVLPGPTRAAASQLLNKAPIPQMPSVPQGLLDTALDARLFPGPIVSGAVTGAERNLEDQQEERKRRRSRGGL